MANIYSSLLHIKQENYYSVFKIFLILFVWDKIRCPVVPTEIQQNLDQLPNKFHPQKNSLHFSIPNEKVDYIKEPIINKRQALVDKRSHRTKRYAIIIDAGSSGSRIFVYEFHFNKDPSQYVSVKDLVISLAVDEYGDRLPLIRRKYPGLSTFANNTSMAAEYFFDLIESVIDLIPAHLIPGTPLYIMATAGLRLLKQEAQEAILEDCRRDIAARYRQLFFPPHHVSIISGKMEGTYAWIAINYILRNFNKRHTTGTINTGRGTAGIIDMGGASVQIAYEIPFNYQPQADFKDFIKSGVTDLIKIVDLSDYPNTYLGSNPWLYKVYVATFLGFGANEIINVYHQGLLENFVNELIAAKSSKEIPDRGEGKEQNGGGSSTIPKLPILDPCHPKGLTHNVTGMVTLPTQMGQLVKPKKWTVTLPVVGMGDFIKCQLALKRLLNLQIPCNVPPCSFNGIHQPPAAFPDAKFYGVSEFWYTSQNIKAYLGPYDSRLFGSRAQDVCQFNNETDVQDINSTNSSGIYIPKAEERCFKASWISTILHQGFSFPRQVSHIKAPIEFVSTVNGREVHWTLGAVIEEIFKDTRSNRG